MGVNTLLAEGEPNYASAQSKRAALARPYRSKFVRDEIPPPARASLSLSTTFGDSAQLLADRPEAKGAREGLSEHLTRICLKGEKDEHRLMVEGLSYLQAFHQEIDSRD